ncbi:MAG: hypothetical protein IK084_06470 [Bacteroidaceae bacterium]|nr:hypothetical protein [Bacteroidaceae bacterium]
MPPGVEHGETVQINAIALIALIDFEQTALAHRGVEFLACHAQLVGIVQAEAALIVVDDEFIGRDAHGQEVVGDEKVEQIVGAGIVPAGGEDIVF